MQLYHNREVSEQEFDELEACQGKTPEQIRFSLMMVCLTGLALGSLVVGLAIYMAYSILFIL